MPNKAKRPFLARDKWLSRDGATPLRYDKIEHLIFFGAVAWSLYLFAEASPFQAQMIARLLGIANEVKDYLINYQDVPKENKIRRFLAGDGFSLRDLTANELGIATLWIV
jgi:hypothetical protein